MLADPGLNYLATVVMIVAVVIFSRTIWRGNRRGWLGIGIVVVVVLALGALVKDPASVQHSNTPSSLISHADQ